MTVQLNVLKTKLWDSAGVFTLCPVFVSAGLPIPFSFPSPCSVARDSFYCRGCPLSLSQTLASSSSCILMWSWVNLPPLTPPLDSYSYLTVLLPCKPSCSPSLPDPFPHTPNWQAMLSHHCHNVVIFYV